MHEFLKGNNMGHYDDAYESMYAEQRKEQNEIKNKVIPEILNHLKEASKLIRKNPSIFYFPYTRLEQDLTILIKLIETESIK